LGSNRLQQRVLADRKQEPPGEALLWATAKGETEMADDALQRDRPQIFVISQQPSDHDRRTSVLPGC
jgi:hypothetical protein